MPGYGSLSGFLTEFIDNGNKERQQNYGMLASRSQRANSTSRKKIRVVKNSTANKSPRRKAVAAAVKKAPQRASIRHPKSPSRGKVKVFTDVPGWKDLIKEDNRRHPVSDTSSSIFGAISTLRFTLSVLAVVCIFTLYVGHVYATRSLLSDVHAQRKENLSLRLQYNRTKGVYDAATGPAVIYRRAKTLGLEEKMISGPIVRISQR